MRSQNGYTGVEARETMLKNSLFVDARVDLYARTGAMQWARLGEYPIHRRVIAPGH